MERIKGLESAWELIQLKNISKRHDVGSAIIDDERIIIGGGHEGSSCVDIFMLDTRSMSFELCEKNTGI